MKISEKIIPGNFPGGGKPESILKDQLVASEIRYRRLFESAEDGILILESETGKIIDVNPFLIRLLGYSKEKFMGKEIWEIGLFNDIAANREKFLELQDKEYVRYENLPLETIDGRKINVEFVSNVYLENHQKIIQCNIRDITERKKRENELIESEIRRRTLLYTIPDLIWSKNIKGEYLACNTMFERYFGATEADLIGKTDYDFLDVQTAGFFWKNDNEAMYGGKLTSTDEWVTFADDGHEALLEIKKAPMYDARSKLIGMLGIGRDITERKRVEIELIKAKENAEKSDRLKSAFLANMSHEIRTPMNGILGFSGLLKEPLLNDEQRLEYIGYIEKSGARMLDLINDMISISKVESGQMEISVSMTNTNELIENICGFFKPEIEQKNLKLTFVTHLNANEATIKTDKEKVNGVLTNLIKNAIKFTETGSIEVGSVIKSDFLEFFVKDTGIGVLPEQKEYIFDRFRQGSESLIRNYEGSGLGLSISKAFVEMLGGKIWVESNPDISISIEQTLTNGSIFFFTIPLKNNATETNKVLVKKPQTMPMGNKLTNLKILLVEDDEISVLLMTYYLKKLSQNIFKVSTGADAVDVCSKNPDIDLILMDIKMPEMDGLEATRKIRSFNQTVKIIAQTAYGLSADREKAITAGCNEYISKPVDLTLMNNLIKKLFIN